VVDVSVKTADAQKSARVANAAANMIVDNESNLRSGSNQRAVDFIGGKLAQLRDRVSQDDAAIAKLKTDLKITEAGQGEVLQERRVAELNQQLVSPPPIAARPTPSSINCARPISAPRGASRGDPVSGAQRPTRGLCSPNPAGRRARNCVWRASSRCRGRQCAAWRHKAPDRGRKGSPHRLRQGRYLEARKREALVADELHKAQADSGATDQDAVQLRDLETQ